MDAQTLITELSNRGIRLIPNPPKLIVVPAAKLTDEDCEAIRRHKAGLLALLVVRTEQSEIARICRRCGYHIYDSERVFCPACKTRLNTDKREAVLLDAERREADRQAKRGYDFDSTSPSYAEYVSRANPRAYSIIAACRRYGVALRIDPDGTLVVGKAGAGADQPTQPWPSLLIAIEAHLEAVASLVEGGWHLRADFPQGEVA
jgi:RNA polymerase subunit RPABC4/transcription elongation factor Spt4